jgi:hypothetical protein
MLIFRPRRFPVLIPAIRVPVDPFNEDSQNGASDKGNNCNHQDD